MPSQTPTLDQIAAKRGTQTLAQGLAIDVLVAVALVLATIIPGIQTWQDVVQLWPAWLLLVSKSAAQAAVAWVVRRYADTAGVEQIGQ